MVPEQSLKSGKQKHESNRACFPNEWFLSVRISFTFLGGCLSLVAVCVEELSRTSTLQTALLSPPPCFSWVTYSCSQSLCAFFFLHFKTSSSGNEMFPTWLRLRMRMSLVWASWCLCSPICLCLSHKCEPGFTNTSYMWTLLFLLRTKWTHSRSLSNQ